VYSLVGTDTQLTRDPHSLARRSCWLSGTDKACDTGNDQYRGVSGIHNLCTVMMISVKS